MSEIRQKVNDILKLEKDNSLFSSKKETSLIVNEIKNKIQDFKNKKNSSSSIREKELNIDVNFEMLNKFKQNKTNSEEIHVKKLNGLKTELKSNTSNKINTNSETFPLTNGNYSSNTNSNSQTSIHKNCTKSFLYSDTTFDKQKEVRNKSEDKEKKIILDAKRNVILDSLNSKNYDKNLKLNLNVSNISTKSNEDRKSNKNANTNIRDKIKNFVFEIDRIENINKKTNIENNSNNNKGMMSTNFNNYNFSPKFEQTKDDYIKKSPSIFENNTRSKLKLTDLKLKKDDTDEFFSSNFHSNNDRKNYSPIGIEVFSTHNNSKLKAEEIKKIAHQLRFCSPDQLRKMDDNLIDELINLMYTISKTFELKIKSKEARE